MSKYLNLILLVAILILAGTIIIKPQTQSDQPKAETKTELKGQPSMAPANNKQYEKAEQVIKTGKSYTATLHTSAGDIVIELAKDMPTTVNSFVFLAKDGFYDNVVFHRVIPGFMIQGGDPTGTGMGGPGYKFADEKFTGEYKRGTLAMANSGPNTNGSQFFIMHADYPLPPNYTIFGQTVSGLEVVDKIATAKTGPNDRPLEPVVIKSVDITEK
jgi:cyclophilin family peptidyl-prolyl cis-trans isomerase